LPAQFTHKQVTLQFEFVTALPRYQDTTPAQLHKTKL
jgi:hypothetical protein